LAGVFIGPAVAIGLDYLFWLTQPMAGGEGGFVQLGHFVTYYGTVS
jgi:hypothetical protein